MCKYIILYYLLFVTRNHRIVNNTRDLNEQNIKKINVITKLRLRRNIITVAKPHAWFLVHPLQLQ